jgi:hypothetical protein
METVMNASSLSLPAFDARKPRTTVWTVTRRSRLARILVVVVPALVGLARATLADHVEHRHSTEVESATNGER